MAIKPVKNFNSAMANAPTLTGASGAGKMQLLLQACLVDGFNLLTPDSLVISGGVLTGTKAGHGFVIDQVIATTANEAALIGEWTVTSVTSSTFTSDATGVANTTGTGTMTAKAAPLGWVNAFPTVGNVAAFKSGDALSSNCILRVDDSGTTTARVVGYETMTDLNTGTNGGFPSTTQASGGGYFGKSATADTTVRPWALVGDGRLFYLLVNHPTTLPQNTLHCFGDFGSEKAGDAYNCMLACPTGSAPVSSTGSNNLLNYAYTLVNNSGLFVPRSFTGLGSSILGYTGFAGLSYSGSTGSQFLYPSQASNGLVLTPISMREATTAVLRSLALPGIYATPQIQPLTHLDKVSGVVGLSGKTLMACATHISGAEGRCFFDITGPWR